MNPDPSDEGGPTPATGEKHAPTVGEASTALRGPTDRFVLGVVLLVFSAALFVTGVQLLVDCGPTVAGVCAYPFQDWGCVLLYFAALAGLASWLEFARDGRVTREESAEPSWREAPVVYLVVVGLTVLLFVVVVLIL